MIQLATEPASRLGFRPAPSDGQAAALDARRGRGSHAWPFPSRYVGRPQPQNGAKAPRRDSGS